MCKLGPAGFESGTLSLHGQHLGPQGCQDISSNQYFILICSWSGYMGITRVKVKEQTLKKKKKKQLLLSISRRTSAWLQSLHPGNPTGQTQNSHPKPARGEWARVSLSPADNKQLIVSPLLSALNVVVKKLRKNTSFTVSFFSKNWLACSFFHTLSSSSIVQCTGDLPFAITLAIMCCNPLLSFLSSIWSYCGQFRIVRWSVWPSCGLLARLDFMTSARD